MFVHLPDANHPMVTDYSRNSSACSFGGILSIGEAMPWFVYKRTYTGYNPQIVFNIAFNNEGKPPVKEYVQSVFITDEDVHLGIPALKRLYPLEEKNKCD